MCQFLCFHEQVVISRLQNCVKEQIWLNRFIYKTSVFKQIITIHSHTNVFYIKDIGTPNLLFLFFLAFSFFLFLYFFSFPALSSNLHISWYFHWYLSLILTLHSFYLHILSHRLTSEGREAHEKDNCKCYFISYTWFCENKICVVKENIIKFWSREEAWFPGRNIITTNPERPIITFQFDRILLDSNPLW